MTKKRTRHNYGIGSIIAVPLPDRRYAFAKVFKNRALGVYDLLSKKVEPVSEVTKHKIAFYQSATDEPIRSGDWPIIGEEPFADDESAWAPPRAVGPVPGLPIDPNVLRIEHRGESRKATLSEAAGLDISMLAHEPDLFINVLMDRLVRGEHNKYRVKR